MTVRYLRNLAWSGICLASELLTLLNFVDPNSPASLKYGSHEYIRNNQYQALAIPIVYLLGMLILNIRRRARHD